VKRTPTDVADTAKAKARQALDPLAEFLREEAAGGIALVVAAVAAVIWATARPGTATSASGGRRRRSVSGTPR
jgi:hypothetical protein